jgi:zinc transporter 1/2/3
METVGLTESSTSIFSWKVQCMVIIAFTGMLGGMVPLYLRVKDRWMSLGNTLAGGIFLSAGLAHMLPESIEGFKRLGLSENLEHYPLPFVLCIVGIVGTMILEQMGNQQQQGGNNQHGSGHGGHGHSHGFTMMLSDDHDDHDARPRSPVPLNYPPLPTTLASLHMATTGGGGGGAMSPMNPSSSSSSSSSTSSSHTGISMGAGNGSGSAASSSVSGNSSSGVGSSSSFSSSLNMYMLAILLCVHSIIEGIALGVEDSLADITSLLVAIVSHKLFDAFAFGVALARYNVPNQKLLRMIAVFSLMTPFGVLIGLLTFQTSASLFSEGVKAVASGTFIYIALVEVLMQEFASAKDRPLKILLLAGGVLLMTLFSSHNHGDEHEMCHI